MSDGQVMDHFRQKPSLYKLSRRLKCWSAIENFFSKCRFK